MSNEIIAWLQSELAKFEGNPVVETAVADVEAAGTATVNYIKTSGLQAAYGIALSLVEGAATGTPWTTLGATLVSQIEAAGISIEKGAEAILLNAAQSDLLVAGKVVSPTTGATIGSSAVSTPEVAPADETLVTPTPAA